MVAIESIVDEGETCYPVAVFQFAIALNVVLTAGKVPHEVAPIHEVDLIREEELQVCPLRGHLAWISIAFVVGKGNVLVLQVVT